MQIGTPHATPRSRGSIGAADLLEFIETAAAWDLGEARRRSTAERRDGLVWGGRSLHELADGSVAISGRDDAVRWQNDLATRIARVLPPTMKPLAGLLVRGPIASPIIDGGRRLQAPDVERFKRIATRILRPLDGKPPSRADRKWLAARLIHMDPAACVVAASNGGTATRTGAAIGFDPRLAAVGSWIALPAMPGQPTTMTVASVMADGTILGDPFPLPTTPARRPIDYGFSKGII
jgi:hypothetical protein